MTNNQISRDNNEELEQGFHLPSTQEMSLIRNQTRLSRPEFITLSSPLHIITEQQVTGVAEAKTVQFLTRIVLTSRKLALDDRKSLYENMIEAGGNIGTSRSSIDLNDEENKGLEDYSCRLFYSDKGILIETIQVVRKIGNGKTSTTSEEKTHPNICKTKIVGDKEEITEGFLNIRCKEAISAKNQTYSRSEKFFIGLRTNQADGTFRISSQKTTFNPTETIKFEENVWLDSKNFGIVVEHNATSDMSQHWNHEQGTFGEQKCEYHPISPKIADSTPSSRASTSSNCSHHNSSNISLSQSFSCCSLRPCLAKAKLTPKNVKTPQKSEDNQLARRMTPMKVVEELAKHGDSSGSEYSSASEYSAAESQKKKSSMRKKQAPEYEETPKSRRSGASSGSDSDGAPRAAPRALFGANNFLNSIPKGSTKKLKRKHPTPKKESPMSDSSSASSAPTTSTKILRRKKPRQNTTPSSASSSASSATPADSTAKRTLLRIRAKMVSPTPIKFEELKSEEYSSSSASSAKSQTSATKKKTLKRKFSTKPQSSSALSSASSGPSTSSAVKSSEPKKTRSKMLTDRSVSKSFASSGTPMTKYSPSTSRKSASEKVPKKTLSVLRAKMGNQTTLQMNQKTEQVTKLQSSDNSERIEKIDGSQPIVLFDDRPRPGKKRQFEEIVELGLSVNGERMDCVYRLVLIAYNKPNTELVSVKFKGEQVWSSKEKK